MYLRGWPRERGFPLLPDLSLWLYVPILVPLRREAAGRRHVGEEGRVY